MPSPGSKPVQVYFSNPDLVFAADFPTPRFAQGALAVALRALLTEVSLHPVTGDMAVQEQLLACSKQVPRASDW